MPSFMSYLHIEYRSVPLPAYWAASCILPMLSVKARDG